MRTGCTKRDPAEIAQRLLEAVQKAQENLQRVEIWAGALSAFSSPVPEYRPSDTYLLGGKTAGGASGQSHTGNRGPSGLRHGAPSRSDGRSTN